MKKAGWFFFFKKGLTVSDKVAADMSMKYY